MLAIWCQMMSDSLSHVVPKSYAWKRSGLRHKQSAWKATQESPNYQALEDLERNHWTTWRPTNCVRCTVTTRVFRHSRTLLPDCMAYPWTSSAKAAYTPQNCLGCGTHLWLVSIIISNSVQEWSYHKHPIMIANFGDQVQRFWLWQLTQKLWARMRPCLCRLPCQGTKPGDWRRNYRQPTCTRQWPDATPQLRSTFLARPPLSGMSNYTKNYTKSWCIQAVAVPDTNINGWSCSDSMKKPSSIARKQHLEHRKSRHD